MAEGGGEEATKQNQKGPGSYEKVTNEKTAKSNKLSNSGNGMLEDALNKSLLLPVCGYENYDRSWSRLCGK